jgi:hypothetical protein
MMLWKANDYTTCTSLHNDPDEQEDYDDFMASTQMLGNVIIYSLLVIVGMAISCGCWWLSHRA